MEPVMFANRYRPLGALGAGAMGEVWRVHDASTGAEAALKIIKRDLGATERSLLQFKQEFRLMAQLRHPNCCAVHDFGVLADGNPYFTMELVPGRGLDEQLPLGLTAFADVMAQLALALGYIHHLGFVHRDLKSANVRVRPDGVVKLMDYGLMDYGGQVDALTGTLGYMAPEVVQRGPVDARADLYALGCLAYELLTGQVPFVRPKPMDVLRAHLTEAPVPPRRVRPEIPEAYERLVLALLAKEPGARPQDAAQVLAALGVAAPSGLGGTLMASPLLGREAEVGRLGAAIGELLEGRAGPVLLLHGPPGVGKSRLLQELRCQAQLAGLPFALGNAVEHQAIPYAPFVAALRDLLPAASGEAAAVVARHRAVLRALLPELGGEAAPGLDSPAKERLRLHAAVTEVLAAIASVQPFVLCLENWHWIDPASAALAGHLRRNARDAAILVVLTSRRAEPGDTEWARELDQVALGALDADGLARMLRAMLGEATIDPAFAADVARLTEGNPFFVERLLDRLVRDGALVREGGRWNAGPGLLAAEAPMNLAGLLRDMLAGLPEGALAVARLGALLGREVDLDLLGATAGMDEDDLLAAVARLREARVLVHAQAGRYAFAHDQLQELLSADLRPDERVALHGRVYAALAARLGDRPIAEAPLDLVVGLATHALAAGVDEATARLALEAGRRLLALFDLAAAERFLAAGLQLVPAGAGDPARRWGYLAALGDVQRIAGRQDAAIARYEEALALAPAVEPPIAPLTLGRLMTSLAKARQIACAYDQALATAERAEALMAPLGPSGELARCILTASRLAYFAGDVERALREAARGRAVARAAGAPLFEGEALGFLGYLRVGAGDDGGARAGVIDLEGALALLEPLGDRVGLSNAYNLLGNAQAALGEYRAAYATFELTRTLCVEAGIGEEALFARLNLAMVAYELGDFPATADLAHGVATEGAAAGLAFPAAAGAALEATARVHLGDHDEALAQLGRALDDARRLQNRYLETYLLAYEIAARLHVADDAGAATAWAALGALMHETGHKTFELVHAIDGAWLAGRRGDLDAAEAAIDRAAAAAEGRRQRGHWVRAMKVKAWLAARRERPADAARLAAEGLAVARDLGVRLQVADLEGIAGEAALALGEDAGPRFEAMAVAAAAAGLKLQEARGWFGLAAAMPPGAEADAVAVRARAILEPIVARLAPASREAFLAAPEVRPVLEGGHEAWARARRPKPAAQPEVRLGMGSGLFRM